MLESSLYFTWFLQAYLNSSSISPSGIFQPNQASELLWLSLKHSSFVQTFPFVWDSMGSIPDCWLRYIKPIVTSSCWFTMGSFYFKNWQFLYSHTGFQFFYLVHHFGVNVYLLNYILAQSAQRSLYFEEKTERIIPSGMVKPIQNSTVFNITAI